MQQVDHENNRALLVSTQNLRTHWANNIFQANAIAVATCVAIWSFFLKAYLDSTTEPLPTSYLVIGAGLSSVVLGVWRLYVRYLDNQLAMLYPQLMRYELGLAANLNEGTSAYLAHQLKRRLPCIMLLDGDARLKLINVLVDSKRVGWRGHKYIDIGVMAIMIMFLVVVGLNILNLFTLNSGLLKPMLEYIAKTQILDLLAYKHFTLIVLNFIGSILVLVGLGIDIHAFRSYQRDPRRTKVMIS